MGTLFVKFVTIEGQTGASAPNVSSPGWWNAILGASDPAALLTGINATGVNFQRDETLGGTYNVGLVFGFDQNTPLFSLDGSPYISFNSLPPGFLITALNITGSTQVQDTDGTWTVTCTMDPSADHQLNSVVSNPTTVTIINHDFIDVGDSISALDLISSTLQCLGSVGTFAASPGITEIFQIFHFELTGEYFSVSQTYTLHTPTNPVNTASPVTITSDPNDPNPMNFEDILTVDLEFTDENGDPQTISIPQGSWITIEENLFVFPVDLGGFQPTVINIVVTSSQFSGSVTLGQLITIYFTSASGIYKLVLNKRNDTLYIEADLPNTIDVKIPDPFAKGNFTGA